MDSSFIVKGIMETRIEIETTMYNNNDKTTNLLWPTPVEVKSNSSSRWQLLDSAQMPLSLTLEQPHISRDLLGNTENNSGGVQQNN